MEEKSLGVLIFIVLLLGTVAFLVGTTTGLHLLFNAANRWVHRLEVAGNGRLARSASEEYPLRAAGRGGERQGVPRR